MTEIRTISTSANTADCDPIPLRTTERIRLVFCPLLVKNPNEPAACVKGSFLYQKKNKNDEWSSITGISLASLKSGEGYQLELHSQELLTLMRGLSPLYRIYRQEGIPRGKSKFVKIETGLARFFELGQNELKGFLETHSGDAAEILLKLIKWLAGSPQGISAISQMSASELPALSALLGVSGIKSAVTYWLANETNAEEEFWQHALEERAYVLSQVYSYPIVIIKAKAYLGGKKLDNKGGKLADFLLAAESTNAALIVEVKTPRTKLLGPEYRDGVYPFSSELTGAIAQALTYQRSLGLDFRSLAENSSKKLLMGEPRCLVIAGNSRLELANDAMKESFELQRERLQGVTVITYDELFLKIRRLIELLEKSGV